MTTKKPPDEERPARRLAIEAQPLTLTDWIVTLRLREQLTQEKFAERVGIDRTTLSDWERGKQEPRYDSIEKIRKAFPDAPPLPFDAGATMSDPGSRMLPGLEVFLDHYRDRLSEAERAFLENLALRGPVELPAARMDDAWWWNFVRNLQLQGDS